MYSFINNTGRLNNKNCKERRKERTSKNSTCISITNEPQKGIKETAEEREEGGKKDKDEEQMETEKQETRQEEEEMEKEKEEEETGKAKED